MSSCLKGGLLLCMFSDFFGKRARLHNGRIVRIWNDIALVAWSVERPKKPIDDAGDIRWR